MKKRMRLIAAITSSVMIICACGTNVNTEEIDSSGTQEKEEVVIDEKQLKLDMIELQAYANVDGLNLEPGTYISVVGKSADLPYWKEVEAGAKQAVADLNDRLGYEGSDKIKFVYSGPTESYNVDEQVNILDEELARYPHALGIALVDAKSCGVQFDLATQNGIYVITYDTTSNYQDVMARIETDNAAAATEAGKKLAEAMGEMGEIVIFMDDSKSATSKERESAFVKEITDNHPGLSIGAIYYEDNLDELKEAMLAEIQTGTYNPVEIAIDEVEDKATIVTSDITLSEVYNYIFLRNENMAGIFTTDSASMLRVLEFCEKYQRADIEIVGFDANEEQVEALEAGTVNGLVLQNPYGMGYATVVACARSIMNEGNEALVDSGYLLLDEDNIKEEAVQSILY